jgi:hypothetical protein
MYSKTDKGLVAKGVSWPTDKVSSKTESVAD